MRFPNFARRLAVVIVASALAEGMPAQSWRDRIDRAKHRSEHLVEVPGGQTFTVPLPLDRAFQAVLNGLKRHGAEIEEANHDIGRIVTGLMIAGGWNQVGRRVVVIFITDGQNQTTVRVQATVQTRHQLMGATKPWSAPKLDNAESIEAATKLKAMLREK